MYMLNIYKCLLVLIVVMVLSMLVVFVVENVWESIEVIV